MQSAWLAKSLRACDIRPNLRSPARINSRPAFARTVPASVLTGPSPMVETRWMGEPLTCEYAANSAGRAVLGLNHGG